VTEDTVTLRPRAVGEYPLTNVQRQIWTSQRLAPEAPLANMGKIHRICGAIDVARFVSAVDEVVRASDALRTVIVDRPGREPRARVLFEPPRSTEVIELPDGELDRWCHERISRPIDARMCSYDSVLLRHGDESWTWWLDLHHVVTDGWSSSLVFDAVSRAYLEAATIEDVDDEPSMSFYDYVSADSPGGEGADAVAWASPEETPIAPYGPRGPRTTSVSRRELSDGVTLLAPHPGYRAFSPSMATLARLAVATAVTLSRLDGRRVVTLGVPLHRRTGPVAPRLIGPLMAMFPLAVDVDLDESFDDCYRRVLRQLLGVVRLASNAEVPDVAFDAVLNVQTVTYGEFAGLPTVTTWARSGHVDPAHPIRVHAYDYGAGMSVELDLNDGLSADGSHRAFVEHLGRTLEAAVLDPAGKVGDFEIASERDRSAIDLLNPPGAGAVVDRPVHEVIASLLRSHPDHVVAEHDDAALTAAQLDQRADAVARHLLDHGVTVGSRVGIRLPRSFDVLVAVHGVMRSGAAFVMLDPDDPAPRHDAIAADAELALIVDDIDQVTSLTATSTVIGHGGDALPDGGATGVTVGLDDIAYVLYTSGSTGRPKGVPIPHRGLAEYLAFAAAAYRPTAQVVMPLYSSLGFDLSITSLFLPQLLGGRTVVFPDDAVSALGRIASDRRLTMLKATPSQLEILCRLATEPLSLEVVIVGGEAFRSPVAEALVARCAGQVRIFNEYGPTEAVVGCMIHEWDPERDLGSDVPIGGAAPGAEVYVLDECRRRTPIGVWGELYVRRPGMARGYLNLPEATAERFVTIDAIGGAPLYRTGDRARLEGDALVYGGRIDDQLSIGGVRLEPGEIEAALVAHPDVTSAVVRVWTPSIDRVRRCGRCGLGTDVPGVDLDGAGTCSVCRSFDVVAPQTETWFRTPVDLDRELERARRRSTSEYDCIHLLSGGKDSTYALYQLVERGWRVHAFTLDNGFISEGAKANVRRSVADLGITHEFATTDSMNEIFRDSLERFSNVCNGCYKTIYTLATARAHEMGIPVIVTGLSRGQFFETRLVPHQFEADRFEPDDIDRTVLQARRAYHHTRDAVTELLPEQALFERADLDVLAEVEFVDYYRYVDVELAEMYEFLTERAPWVRPDDTGRSTNCLVNAVGIHVHKTERGYHNYAEPYSWDVRLGHKTRDEALDELDDDDDQAEIGRMLSEIGYVPKPPHVLTAWYQTNDGSEIDARLLAAHLRDLLPARAIPTAFVHVRELPLAESTKLDVSSLPAPSTAHLGSASYREPATPTQARVAAIWAAVLHVDRVGIDDDFFDLGGASLAALETVAATERQLSIELPDALVFEHRTLAEFADAVDEHVAGGRRLSVIAELDPSEPAPLSPGEEAMLFEYRADPDDVRYNVTRWYRVEADLDLDRLRRAVEVVVARHGPLHTSYSPARAPLPVTEALSFGPLPGGPVDEVVHQLRRVPFDLDHGPLVRVNVGSDDTGAWNIVIGLHHISVDAGTFDLLWNEIDAAYHDGELPELSTSYAAYGAWQRDHAVSGADFWADAQDIVAGVQLPPPEHEGYDGYLERPASVSTSELSVAAASTPFAAALTAAAIVLSGFSRDGVVELGVTASTKDHPSGEPLIGYALNTLPMRIEVDPSATLRSLDVDVSALVARALPHRTHPYADIVRQARLDGRAVPDTSHMLAYERLAPVRFGDTVAEHRIIPSGTAVNDFTFFVQERGEDLHLGIEYRGDVLDTSLAQGLLDGFSEAIDAVCHRPHRTVGDIRPSGDDLIGEQPESVDDDPPTVLASIVDWARREPDRPAVVESSGAVTSYGELLARARGLAAVLRSHVDSPSRIGVSLGRSSGLIEAILGVQLAGASYVPIDPSTPPDRRRALVALASLDAVVVDAATAPLFADVTQFDIASKTATEPAVGLSAGELPSGASPAYVIFTSGSTGEPAGVEVTHANLMASTAARSVFYGDDAPSRFLLTPSIGFDSSMVAIFWPLMSGGSIVVPDDAEVHDVDRLGALIAASDVSHLLMVPSLYRALLSRRPDDLAGVRVAIVAGEACAPDVVAEHHRLLPNTELVDEYGPTEATVWATAHRCSPGEDPVPIGRPIAGSRVRIADDRQRPMAPGAPGELLIAGPGVVNGYLSGRSDSSFVDADGHRWYRTGDIARVDLHGDLLFLGRVDDQLNVGGYRIEPSEVEGHLLRMPGVRDAVVVRATIDGRDALVAHVVGDRDLVDASQVRSRVSDLVGPGAAPRRVVFHDELPRTANGKVDRASAALLALDDAPAARASGLLDIWQRALQRDDLDGNSDFFSEGGDSLAAVEIVTAVGEMIGRNVAIADLLRAPSPAALASHLGIGADATAVSSAVSSAISLVTLRVGSTSGPTVVLTPAWDTVMSYRTLADAFDDDVSVVAVAIVSERAAAFPTVDALGAASIDPVIDELERLGASSVAVGGWSIGGVAAYDLGQRLAARGVEVRAVALIDTMFPGEYRHLWSNRWWKYKSLLRRDAIGTMIEELATTLRRRAERYMASLGRRLVELAGESLPKAEPIAGWGMPLAALDHVPEPTAVPIVLYAANTTKRARTEHRWITVAPDLRVVAIEGRHRGFDSVMGAARVHQIVDDLTDTVLAPQEQQ